jgi:ferric iron reductase protein FhuF
VLLKVQSSIGHSDYVRRDTALAALIQPLAGEYGMHNDQPQGATHRQLFSDWYEGLMGEPLEVLMGEGVAPVASQTLFQQMMRDIMAGGQASDPTEQACYAMGYNLAIEYMADYEKTWMLAAFRELNKRVLAPNGRALTEWLFLEVHAEGDFAEAEHAALGHHAVTSFVPAAAEPLLRAAMLDHDRDFAVFYNTLADMLEA